MSFEPKSRASAVLFAAAAGSVALASLFLPLDAQADIVIGQSAPLSKANASLGTDIRDGALAWFRHVNERGGIHGQKVRLVTLDDENSAKLSGPNTEALIRDHGAIVLFGYASATLSAPALPILEKHGIPLFAPFTGADTIHARKRLVYTVRASYRDEMSRIVSIWSGVGLTRLAVVHYDDPVGRQNFETVKEMLSGLAGARAESIPIQRNARVPADVLERIGRSAAQVIIYTTLAEPIAEIVRQLRAAGAFYNMVALSFAGNSQLRDALGSEGHGLAMSSVVPRYNDASFAAVGEYRRVLAESGIRRQSYASFEAFLAAKALTEALNRAGRNPTSASFIQAMSSVGRLDLGGYRLDFSGGLHGSHFVQLAVLDKNGQFKD